MGDLRVFSLLFFAFCLSHVSQCCAASSKYALPGSRWSVTIYNFQSHGTMSVHCKSKDDDLGKHWLDTDQKYDWQFRENFWRRTLYWCNFRSYHGYASFEVFWPEKKDWLSYRCNYETCIWAAKDDGFYLKNIPENKFELVHPWVTRS